MSARVQDLFNTKIKKVIFAYERGQDIKDIAKQVGVSAPTIAKWLTQEGYKRRKKGRVPLAMKSRVRDLKARGWDRDRIAELLDLGVEKVDEWSRPLENPILGGEKDPLKVRGQRNRKKDKIKGSRRGRPPKPSKKNDKWPPGRHKCDKHWTPLEKSYVLELIEKNISPLAIYRKTRASRNRQTKIWREGGGSGMPPNFPPSRGPFLPQVPGDSAGKKDLRDRQKKAEERINQLEEEAAERKRKIAELEERVAEEESLIKSLESQQKKLTLERRERAERLSQARAAIEGRKDIKAGRARVLPGSYEDEVLGLKPGTVIEPGRPGRPALPRPDHLGGYSDNGEYFAVSNDWADLEDAEGDELHIFANYLTSRGFPSRAEKTGDQPKAYFESSWPKKVESKWNTAVDGGLALLEKYKERKAELESKKFFSKPIARYLAKAYSATADPTVPSDKKKELKDDLLDDWARLKKIDRLILIFKMGAANLDGSPTVEGIERGKLAKIILEKSSREASAMLSARKEEMERKKELRQAEKEEVDAILSGARLALGPGDES